MKRGLFTLAIVLFLIGCTNEMVKETFYEGGELRSKLFYPDKRDTSYYRKTEYYPSGELLSNSTIKEGRLEGDYCSYYVTGNLFEKGRFLNGNMDGIFQQYDSLRRLATESYFINGTRILYSVGLHTHNARFEKQLFNIVVKDSIYPIGALVWKNDTIQSNLSHYAVLIGEDTISNLNYSLKVQIFTDKKPSSRYKITFGKPNTMLEFEEIDTSCVTSNQETSFEKLILSNGHNKIFGRIYEFDGDTTALFYVYKNVFVKSN